MPKPEEISKGIAAHGMWKIRLRSAIDTGKADVEPAKAALDNACPFGQWFYSLSPAEQSSLEAKTVKELHARFHKEAAAILKLALAGQKDHALNGIAADSPYTKLSAELTGAMVKWKAA